MSDSSCPPEPLSTSVSGTRIVFLHGLESGPYGSKYAALRGRYPHVTSPDCEGVFDMEERLVIIREHLGEEPALLVGSSFGGLASALVRQRWPGLVLGVVLCAPALHRHEAAGLDGLGSVPAVIIHGTQDDIVPIEVIREFAEAHDVKLIEVDDGHRLGQTVAQILEQVGVIQSCIAQA